MIPPLGWLLWGGLWYNDPLLYGQSTAAEVVTLRAIMSSTLHWKNHGFIKPHRDTRFWVVRLGWTRIYGICWPVHSNHGAYPDLGFLYWPLKRPADGAMILLATSLVVLEFWWMRRDQILLTALSTVIPINGPVLEPFTTQFGVGLSVCGGWQDFQPVVPHKRKDRQAQREFFSLVLKHPIAVCGPCYHTNRTNR